MMMKRGEIWTISGSDYAGKPRPAVVLQDDAFQSLESVTMCPFTTDFRGTEIVRVLIEPNERNGLQRPSKLMADKITTLSRAKIGKHIGVLDAEGMQRLDRAVMIFLGLG
jgi:mRNA interferase MazF